MRLFASTLIGLAMPQQWKITVGILMSYIVALIIFSAFPGGAASTGWRLVLGLGAIPALIGLGLHTQMPQSPGDCSGTAATPRCARPWPPSA